MLFLKERTKPKNIYADFSSGAKAERKGLDEMLGKLREGDTVVVWKMDRIARSLSHLVKLIDTQIIAAQNDNSPVAMKMQ
ncbi:MAG: recombinase family protein [Pricia sp.]